MAECETSNWECMMDEDCWLYEMCIDIAYQKNIDPDMVMKMKRINDA